MELKKLIGNHKITNVTHLKKLEEYDCVLIACPGQDLVNLIRETYQDKIIIAINRKADVDMVKEILKTDQEHTIRINNDY